MTLSSANEPESLRETKMPRRDWILLPMLSLLTVCLVAGSVELTARHIFPQLDTLGEDCMVFNDPVTGARGIPNSVCREKIPEGELTEYRFNSCGHRAGMECGPKAAGVYRIVMIGTSSTLGMRVPREKTFAASLPLELSQRTGHEIELYNEAIPYRSPDTLALHFNEILKAEPDMILWGLYAGDIESQSQVVAPNREIDLSFPVRVWHRIIATFATKSFAASIQYFFRHTRIAVLLSDALYTDQRQFVKSSLMATDHDIGYLKAEPSPEWQARLNEFDGNVTKFETQARAAGVPLVVFLLPAHAHADMIIMGEWPAGFDPYKLDEELSSIVTSRGGTYIDILPDVRTISNLQQGYFPFDGHLNARGHAILSGILAKELTSGAVPALKVTTPPQAAMEGSR